MPINNFEGYTSWGYNSNFFFAPDKVYGTSNALRQFVDACHAQGIAVILDLAMADVSGSSPLASMYWNSSTNKPATNNPWLNATATNGNVVGSQFNHSSQATIDLRNRVYKHWLKDYNMDGFRFDLFGGYTQNSSDGSYDATRVSNAANINASLQSISPGSYCILESFEPENADQVNNNDVLVWGNGKLTSQISQAGESNLTSSDFVGAGLYTNNGCNKAGLVDYQESHDEVRVMYNIEKYGKIYGSYNTQTVTTALQRAAMGTAFWALMPGPKMMWMFGELGYDYGDNACADGTTTCGRLDPKPLPWSNYYTDANRQALYNVYSKLFQLRNDYASTFLDASSTKYNTSGLVRWMNLWSTTLQVTVYGNFDVAQQSGTISFPSNGTWYNFFTGATINVSNYTYNVTLNPGEYYVYVNLPNALPVSWIDFSAQYQNGGTVLLNWTTANELANDHYDVERSIDGKNFTHLGAVSAVKNVTSNSIYNFNDATAPAGKVYYRVKQVDVTGKYSYSKIVAVTTDARTNSWHTFYTGTSVRVALQSDITKVVITLRDASGKLLVQQSAGNASNGQTIDVPVGKYAKGLYLITVSSDQGSRTDKVMVK
jgi:glycosidase